jgi:hypothetical protein
MMIVNEIGRHVEQCSLNKVLLKHLPAMSKENHVNPQSRYMDSVARIEPRKTNQAH